MFRFGSKKWIENQDALRLIVNAAEQGVATLHKEIVNHSFV
jgi:hypothetical protein